MKRGFLLILSALLMTAGTYSQPYQATPVELKHFALNSLEGVRATTGATFDRQTSSDGKGSIRVDAEGPIVVPIFEVTDVNIEQAVLIYQASLRSEKLEGNAFLEMWVRLPGKGEFFSRGMDRPITGTTNWMTAATPFFLQAGQKPDLIRLNLVIQGKGRVWIDDIHLMRSPLPNR